MEKNVVVNGKIIDHIEVNSLDFVALSKTRCRIINIKSSPDRFICPVTDEPIKIDPQATTAYWFEQYADVIFARHFLVKNGYISQIALDEHYDVRCVIFTNYEVE